MAAYRVHYSSSHVLIRLIEHWKKALDENVVAGTVLIDLSKAFDCIPHDLLIAKLHAYVFSEKTVTFVYYYLKRQKQNVKTDNIFSSFQTLLSGIPQGSILGPILFNIFLNDLLTVLKKSQLYNFFDDNAISAVSKSTDDLLITLKNESELAVKWFTENNMIVNPYKFQTMVLQKQDKNSHTNSLNIGNKITATTKSVKLLGITIGSQLRLDEHIYNLCNKASMQLNANNRLQRYMGSQGMKAIINSSIYANFKNCLLVWHFFSCKSSRKIEQIQKRYLRIILDDYTGDYETLLEKGKTSTKNVKRIRILATEIFKTINNLNPSFMKDSFTSKVNLKV